MSGSQTSSPLTDPPGAQAIRKGRRLPDWLKVRLPRGPGFAEVDAIAHASGEGGLHTVCRSARCPNVFDCFSRRTATFLLMGGVCLRGCAFCNIAPGHLTPIDPEEPRRVAESAARLGLAYVVLTSVTRDDLPDGGAGHFAATVREIRARLPEAGVELLIPDFRGDAAALATVLAERPTVLNHNVETVPRLYQAVRPRADFAQSLELLRRAAGSGLAGAVKSGFMLGLGETLDEARDLVTSLVCAGCGIVTVGQYLRPSRTHPEPERYVHPDEFEELAAFGRTLGANMFCGPLVRSSFHAAERAAESTI